jgi:hypothetical protein
MKYEVTPSDLKIDCVDLSMFLKINSITLELTEYDTHYCASLSIDYHGRGVMGHIIGFGTTPFLALREMVYSLNEHATNKDELYPRYRNGRRLFINYKIRFDWENLKEYLPKNLKVKKGLDHWKK